MEIPTRKKLSDLVKQAFSDKKKIPEIISTVIFPPAGFVKQSLNLQLDKANKLNQQAETLSKQADIENDINKKNQLYRQSLELSKKASETAKTVRKEAAAVPGIVEAGTQLAGALSPLGKAGKAVSGSVASLISKPLTKPYTEGLEEERTRNIIESYAKKYPQVKVSSNLPLSEQRKAYEDYIKSLSQQKYKPTMPEGYKEPTGFLGQAKEGIKEFWASAMKPNLVSFAQSWAEKLGMPDLAVSLNEKLQDYEQEFISREDLASPDWAKEFKENPVRAVPMYIGRMFGNAIGYMTPLATIPLLTKRYDYWTTIAPMQVIETGGFINSLNDEVKDKDLAQSLATLYGAISSMIETSLGYTPAGLAKWLSKPTQLTAQKGFVDAVKSLGKAGLKTLTNAIQEGNEEVLQRGTELIMRNWLKQPPVENIFSDLAMQWIGGTVASLPMGVSNISSQPQVGLTIEEVKPETQPIPKELESLTEEARKYKSAEEFINRIPTEYTDFNYIKGKIKQLEKDKIYYEKELPALLKRTGDKLTIEGQKDIKNKLLQINKELTEKKYLLNEVEKRMTPEAKALSETQIKQWATRDAAKQFFTDFYNQAVKGTKEVKPERAVEEAPVEEKVETSGFDKEIEIADRIESMALYIVYNKSTELNKLPQDIQDYIYGIADVGLDESLKQGRIQKAEQKFNKTLKNYPELTKGTKEVKPETQPIPKELESLAEEARKYKSYIQFEADKKINYPIEQTKIQDSKKELADHLPKLEKLEKEIEQPYYQFMDLRGKSRPYIKRNLKEAQRVANYLKEEIKNNELLLKYGFKNGKDFYDRAVKGVKPTTEAQSPSTMPLRAQNLPVERGLAQEGIKLPTEAKQPHKLPDILKPQEGVQEEAPNLPVVIRGENFVWTGTGKVVQATKKEIANALRAEQKAFKLKEKEKQKREETLERVNRFHGDTGGIIKLLKSRNLFDEDIENIVLEDGTKLIDTVKIKRNPDKSLSTIITKQEIENIAKSYADEVPKEKWEKRSTLLEGVEIPIKITKSFELPYFFFERKGLAGALYDPIVQAGRDAEVMTNLFIQKFKDAGLFKEGSWFTADRFDISDSEAESVARYYLGRQKRGPVVNLEDLSEKSKKFIEIFDSIIKETEGRFYDVAKKMGKKPGKVENYAPLMTSKDIRLIDQAGAMDWLFRNHPAFFSLKERVKRVPTELYELDYREVAARWLDGITQFLNYGETTNHLKYLINSDQFKSLVKQEDWKVINEWLRDITTPKLPTSAAGEAVNDLSRLMRKGTAMGSLGLNYATVIKQALTQIPMTIIEKAPPKLKSEYAEAFGINVADLPSITKRRGDIAIQDLQGKIGRIFTGAITEADKIQAQMSLNALLDKEYNKFLKQGAEITPEVHKIIRKSAQDALDMWYGGFLKGQKPPAFREELGNFILMFLYPLTSQLNGFYRHIFRAQGLNKFKSIAEVMAAVTAIAYLEQVIENLSFKWSDEKEMTKDVLLSLSGNIPLVGNIAYSIVNEKEFNVSPVLGNISNIIKAIGKGEGEKIVFTTAETFGLPKTARRIKEGMEIMEKGGITDEDGKMLAPVKDTAELVRSFLRGKYGSLAAKDWIRNVGEKKEDRRWFVPQVEFLQNGDYDRKAELYLQFGSDEQRELREFLSEDQQKRLDKSLFLTSLSPEIKREIDRLQEGEENNLRISSFQEYPELSPEDNKIIFGKLTNLSNQKLGGLIATEQYQNATDEEKAKMISSFMDKNRDFIYEGFIANKIKGLSGQELMDMLSYLKKSGVLNETRFKKLIKNGVIKL